MLMSKLFLTESNTKEKANGEGESERVKRFEKFKQNHLHLEGVSGEMKNRS